MTSLENLANWKQEQVIQHIMDMVEVDNVIHCSPKEQGYTRLL